MVVSKSKLFILSIIGMIIISGCISNNPYPPSQRGENVYYSTFDEEPKHLDPAIAYSLDEYHLMAQIYEPPLAYHYLKRPYELIPLTAESIQEPLYFDSQDNPLPKNATEEQVAKAIYEVRIKPGIMYQQHPCFAKDENGNFSYHSLKNEDIEGIYEVRNFPKTGTRELVADDYVYQIKRMADPNLPCPILSILQNYISGMKEYSEELSQALEKERGKRRKTAGASYNQELDERQNPIHLDLNAYPFPGVHLIDKYTYQIILSRKYPQILYWLAMPFFSPIPLEAINFYNQGVLNDRNITLDRFPVGTGPYKMDVYDPHKEIILTKNENFREEFYPYEGEQGDKELGLLDDAGKRVPFIDRYIHKLEKEFIPRWNKFLQGYYDTSGISSDTFDRAIQFRDQGDPEVSKMLQDRDIKLMVSVETSVYYLGFNMNDDVVGGYTEDKQKLRQAISIALDYEEYIQIFTNGRAKPAYSPIPPGIFGNENGEKGINPYVYDWDSAKGPVRKSLDEARRLMIEAGYPGGKDKEGKPLVIGFDNAWTGAEATPQLSWIRKKLEAIGITMENRTTDYNRFQDKVDSGNFQFMFWGWIADYPDPENFLFLLYGPNSAAKYGGANYVNYDNPEYNRLFEQVRSMENSPQRLEIIRQMKDVIQRDAPWVYAYHPVSFSLHHQWLKNIKPMEMGLGSSKYLRIEPEIRDQSREEWNRPIIWPVVAFVGFLIIGTIPAIITAWRRERGRMRK